MKDEIKIKVGSVVVAKREIKDDDLGIILSKPELTEVLQVEHRAHPPKICIYSERAKRAWWVELDDVELVCRSAPESDASDPGFYEKENNVTLPYLANKIQEGIDLGIISDFAVTKREIKIMVKGTEPDWDSVNSPYQVEGAIKWIDDQMFETTIITLNDDRSCPVEVKEKLMNLKPGDKFQNNGVITVLNQQMIEDIQNTPFFILEYGRLLTKINNEK